MKQGEESATRPETNTVGHPPPPNARCARCGRPEWDGSMHPGHSGSCYNHQYGLPDCHTFVPPAGSP